jgi:chemotaxis protein methyltransferase CheR
MREATANYIRAGGRRAFSDYYLAGSAFARLRRTLSDPIVWAQHSLVSDASFNEFHVILCRNVLIYFARPLQDRVHGLIHASLAPFGVLGVGSRESLRFTAFEDRYEPLAGVEHLYRRIG